MPLALPGSPLQVWAVDDDAVQLTWGALPAGAITAEAGTAGVTVEHRGGPGALELGGLTPGTAHEILVRWPGGRRQLTARTATPPPGRELCRVATISDLHLGSRRWGALKTMTDDAGATVPFPLRCARAAVSEAVAWGAELLIVKGDAADHQDHEHFELVGDLLDEVSDRIPVLLVPGNHEVDGRGRGPVPATVGRRAIPYERGAFSTDLEGLRVVVADTSVPGRGQGSIDAVADEILAHVADADRPFLLAVHHHFHPWPLPTIYPIGIAHPRSVEFLDELAARNPNGLVTSGHTHRNRARHHGPLRLTEVGSTRDWPGVWAGYVVHEGGIRQVVRRAAAPEAVTWHEYSRLALLGWWGRWARGPLDHRCFTHLWR
ncbi:MAG: metallophosphoesterase family protein [Acidimicrobiales bacterium]